MLPIVLVLLVASSAFAAPSVSVSQYSINEIAPARDYGKKISSYLTNRAFETVDGGDTNIYILTIEQILDDMANKEDETAQAMALAVTTGVLGELVYSVPGDACPAASAIDALVGGRGSQAARSYLVRLAQNFDAIAQAAVNPNVFRNSVAPRSNCAGNGRSYQFEAAWDKILDNTSPYILPLVNEEYCAAKRLYTAFNARSNNVGAAVTASSLPEVVSAFKKCLPSVINFYRVLAAGQNAAGAAAAAKYGLLN